MKKIVVFMHASLDGFVAGTQGEMEWIKVDDAMFDYASERTDNSDIALYGRKTYQMMDSYWPTAGSQPNASKHDISHSAWYNNVEKVVLSKTLAATEKPGTRFIADNALEEVRKLKQGEGKDIAMFGSASVVHALTKAGLVDDYWIFVNPVLLGAGLPLFPELTARQSLKLVKVQPFASGVVCLHYTA